MPITRSSSALRIATPSSGSDCTSSALPLTMASMLPARSRCTGPIIVTTPTCGLGDLAQQGDITRNVETHLQHGVAMGAVALSKVSGRPISLLKLLSLARVGECEANTLADQFLGGGLAHAPVMPMTRSSLQRLRQCALPPARP